MTHQDEHLTLIPPDTPYSIVICESIYPKPYRVEGLASNADDPDIFGCGTLEECQTLFQRLKAVLIEDKHYVQEVGCCVSRTQAPRQMLINFSAYHVWKTLYRNFNAQAKVREVDKILTEVRQRFRLTEHTS